MASSVIAAAGKTLGSRHNSHNNLVASDSISDWLNGSSHNNTPKGPTAMSTYDSLHRQDSFGSLTDGFDIVSAPMLKWSNTAESKVMSLNNADDFLSDLVEHSIDLKSNFTSTLHVDDFFNEDASNSSSPNMGTTINLPGWNHGPEVMGGLFDSDVDSPEGIWYGQTQTITSKAARRGPDVPSFSINIQQSDFGSSPGSSGPAGFETLNPLPSTAGGDVPLLLGAPARTLRAAISAPLLQRDDPVLEAAGTQSLINDYLVDVGYPQDRIPEANALGLDLGPRSSAACSPAQDAGVQGKLSSDGIPVITELAGGSSVVQSSALFQRRAEQRDLHAPSPVAVVSADNSPALGDRTIEVAPGRTVTVNNPTESTIDPKDMTEGQRRRIAQLHQIHIAQQAARLGVYQDFVAPSQQFAGQEASERAAKAVQAALLYGMEGNSPRKLSMGSTGLPTPVTPQHPLHPGPSSMAYHPQSQAYLGMQTSSYPGADFDPRAPGMPLSADSANFAPSIQNQFSNLHFAQQAQQQQQQGVFTPQFLHQHDTTLFAGPSNAAQQGMAGYTSVYPPPRHNSISGGSTSGGTPGLTLTANVITGPSGEQMLLAPRRATIMGSLRASESSPSLASQIAANPMQLQNPFSPPKSVMTTLEPAQLIGTSATGLVPPAASTPRSAPADASREHLALQQTRMRQLQQQQLQFLHMQNQAVQQQQAAGKPIGQVTTRKVPGMHSTPLSPPRSPAKMKSTPHLRSPLGGIMAGLPPSPSKPLAPGLRKIASNRRITVGSVQPGASSSTGSSSASSSSTGGATLKPRSSTIGSIPGFTMELTTSASPTRARTISVQSIASTRSISSPGKSKSPTPSALASGSGNGGFSSLSFVNYGMNDADEICSAVAPSGSYKVPLRGFGTSSGEEDDFDDDLQSIRSRTTSNVTGMMGSDDDVDSPGSAFAFGAAPGSPTKKIRKNSSRPNLMSAGPGSPLKSKRSMANLGGPGGRAWDLTRSPRKAKSTILSPVPSTGSGA